MNNNYSCIFEKPVEDLKSKAILLKHKKSGARVFVLSNDDDNKVFYIGFRTPPYDDTGVAHIMEHSVLCGSEKYPIKDPFVELVKGSLNTFLNAMTYPDKTVYPVASRNDKDFKNLMDVYIDAVLHPNIYKNPEIFRQEGISYKLEDEEAKIEYNGVVYNEMKGAFSSPESVLDREILHELYPDTPYGVESGGDPKSIPDLTYESFLDFHRRYYHPSNSFIYLYGDMDVEERLQYLDEEYLSKYDELKVDSKIKKQAPFDKMRKAVDYYPISEEEDEKENTYLSYSVVCGDNLDPKMYYAMQMIVYALVDTQGAPIRDRLLKEGIGKDILPSYENGILQPYFNIVAKNSDSDKADRFLEIIREEFEKAYKEGLNKQSLIASINSLEFRYKEADFGGYPKGLIYGLNCLDSWLYDDNAPLTHIECSQTFEFLRNNIDTGYFENIIKECLLDNTHSSLLILAPKKNMAEEEENRVAEKLKKIKEGLTKEEIEKIIADTKALAAYQEKEETKEAINTIPLLSRTDLKRESEPYKNEVIDVNGIPVVFHDYFTNGIGYLSLVFDVNEISVSMIPYLSLLKSVFSFVDTENYGYAQLNNEINIYTGGLSLEAGTYSNKVDRTRFSLLADLSAKALYGNLPKTFELIDEVLFKSIYEDDTRLYEIIAELKSRVQMSLNSSGHSVAVLRSNSYFSKVNYVKELMNGIEFYRFIDNLEKNFSKEKETIKTNLKELAEILISGGCIISFTGDKEGLEIVKKEVEKLADKLPKAGEYCKNRFYEKIEDSMLIQKNEGYKTSGAVQYVARTGRYGNGGTESLGALMVLKTIMSYEYLWFNIRVQGGAYGCMCSFTDGGIGSFVTYRDPNLSRSNDVFKNIPEYLKSFEIDEREMTKYVIGTMSSIDGPLTPSGKGLRDMLAYLTSASLDDIQKVRNDIIDCKVDDIACLSGIIEKMLAADNICVIGSAKKVEEDKELFKEVRNLFE